MTTVHLFICSFINNVKERSDKNIFSLLWNPRNLLFCPVVSCFNPDYIITAPSFKCNLNVIIPFTLRSIKYNLLFVVPYSNVRAYIFIICSFRSACTTRLSRNLNSLAICCKEYKFQSFPVCNFLLTFVTYEVR